MKRIMVLVAIALAIVGCNSNRSGNFKKAPANKEVTMVADTTVFMPVCKPITAPRFGCNGKRLSNDKLLGFKNDSVPMYIRLERTQNVSFGNDSSNTAPVVTPAPVEDVDPVKMSSGSSDSGWGWFGDFFKFLLALALLALLIWFLWWLFKQIPTGRTSSSASTGAAAAATSNPKAPAFATTPKAAAANQNNSSHVVSEERTGYEGAIALVAQMQKSSAGGKVKFGELEIEIPPKGINININNTNGTINDIVIEATSEESVSTNDNRQFHRNTGKKEEPKES